MWMNQIVMAAVQAAAMQAAVPRSKNVTDDDDGTFYFIIYTMISYCNLLPVYHTGSRTFERTFTKK